MLLCHRTQPHLPGGPIKVISQEKVGVFPRSLSAARPALWLCVSGSAEFY